MPNRSCAMRSSSSQYGCSVESISMAMRATSRVRYALMASPIIKPAAAPAAPWKARSAGDDYGPPATPDWREVDWSPRVHQVEIEGRKINYCDYGARDSSLRPVVLVHGLAACWQCWLETIPRPAAEGRRVIAPDLPGFGDSDMPSTPISIEGYGRAVEALCDQLDLGQVVAVGHSMGGFTAAEFAIHYPERVERLVLQAAAGISTSQLQREPLLAGARVVGALGAAGEGRGPRIVGAPRNGRGVFPAGSRVGADTRVPP